MGPFTQSVPGTVPGLEGLEEGQQSGGQPDFWRINISKGGTVVEKAHLLGPASQQSLADRNQHMPITSSKQSSPPHSCKSFYDSK